MVSCFQGIPFFDVFPFFPKVFSVRQRYDNILVFVVFFAEDLGPVKTYHPNGDKYMSDSQRFFDESVFVLNLNSLAKNNFTYV